jgi:hypothetical protein
MGDNPVRVVVKLDPVLRHRLREFATLTALLPQHRLVQFAVEYMLSNKVNFLKWLGRRNGG